MKSIKLRMKRFLKGAAFTTVLASFTLLLMLEAGFGIASRNFALRGDLRAFSKVYGYSCNDGTSRKTASLQAAQNLSEVGCALHGGVRGVLRYEAPNSSLVQQPPFSLAPVEGCASCGGALKNSIVGKWRLEYAQGQSDVSGVVFLPDGKAEIHLAVKRQGAAPRFYTWPTTWGFADDTHIIIQPKSSPQKIEIRGDVLILTKPKSEASRWRRVK